MVAIPRRHGHGWTTITTGAQVPHTFPTGETLSVKLRSQRKFILSKSLSELYHITIFYTSEMQITRGNGIVKIYTIFDVLCILIQYISGFICVTLTCISVVRARRALGTLTTMTTRDTGGMTTTCGTGIRLTTPCGTCRTSLSPVSPSPSHRWSSLSNHTPTVAKN